MVDLEEIFDNDDLNQFKKQVWKSNKDLRYADYNLLQGAIYHQAIDIVEFILKEKYFDINEQADDGQTAIVMAMNEFNQDAQDIVEMIFKYYSNIDADITDRLGRNALLSGLFSGIAERYNLRVAEITKNLEQLDTEMDETVVQACIRNQGMFRQHAQLLRMYIERGAVISKPDLYKTMGLIDDVETSIVWKALKARDDLEEDILKIASSLEMDKFLPKEVQDIFLF